MLTYNNWIYTKNDSMFFDHEIRKQMKPHDNYESNIIQQAKLIYEKHKNIIVTVSGGIDSQTAAYAFKKANIPVKYVFADFWFDNQRNELEYMFATQFTKDLGVDLEIIKIFHSLEDIEELMFETGYFDSIRVGIGSTFQFDFLRKLVRTYPNHKIVTASGGFKFLREGNTCSGNMIDLFNGISMFCLNDDVNSSETIRQRSTSFIYYSPIIVKYYELTHKRNGMLQFPASYQPKHLAHVELGFPLRYKLTSAEHLNEVYDYKNITRLNFGKDWKVQMDVVGPNNRLMYEKLVKKYSWDVVKKLQKAKHSSEQYIQVYSFDVKEFS